MGRITLMRHQGMLFDMKVGAAPERYPLESLTCPVLTVSAEDDLFGTDEAAKYVAAHAPDARAVTYPNGGHALVGRFGDALDETASFFGRY